LNPSEGTDDYEHTNQEEQQNLLSNMITDPDIEQNLKTEPDQQKFKTLDGRHNQQLPVIMENIPLKMDETQ